VIEDRGGISQGSISQNRGVICSRMKFDYRPEVSERAQQLRTAELTLYHPLGQAGEYLRKSVGGHVCSMIGLKIVQSEVISPVNNGLR
jgi:hypothetical protein